MIVHNLMLKLKDRSEASICKAKDVLLGMKGKIEPLRDVQVEADMRHAPTSYDLMLVAHFDSMEDFEAYLVHPVHVEVARYVAEVLDTMAGVLYSTPA
jgi:hypothetical protein